MYKMSQYEIFKEVLNGVEYKVKKYDATNCLYLYKNDVYQGRVSFLALFKLLNLWNTAVSFAYGLANITSA